MATIKNTSYKVQSDVNTEAERLDYNIEEGAHVTTSAGVWTVWNGEWVKLYPHSGAGSGKGWVRYDDTQWTSSNKLPLVDQVTITLPNNGGNTVKSHEGIDYYNTTTNRLIADTEKDTYLLTVTFIASAPNANQTHLDFAITDGDYTRLGGALQFYKGNDTPQNFHNVYQYYVDADFVANGAGMEITADGGNAEIWDIIFFIQKVQSYA